ncbi:NUDIX hydrolase [Sanguibacter antarcticus]|uniref:ADP-ribose pyrophosphatase YjhB (NUDIX family) n=1 Tax=Sanguibacter antarcticus TaxID=372484 RepID=A0A2A9E5K5_9MICO|nr:NUDIX domain-containing protein [Sanguibacter antarcticus]PFG33449.1 ADP-ribose pyrophosphatase YjhB (NUDIX family) [Sanguibacter antarcticus]
MTASGPVRFQVVPAAYVVFLREGQVPGILLQLRRDTGYMDGYWATAAAGHVEQGESVVDAALREAHEELGLVLAADQLEPLTVMHRTLPGGGPIEERVDFFFRCTRWDGDPSLQEPEKAADLRWFGWDALPELVVPHERAVFDAVRRGGAPRLMTFGFAA